MVDTPAPRRTPEQLVTMLTELLNIEQLDTDLYRGARLPGGKGRAFGGQVIAQALQAAQRSTDAPKTAHSLHAYFMRAGDDEFPIIFRVVRDFDGKSFATRRVIAVQNGQPILNMAASFQVAEDGLAHQDEMPDAPPPEDLRSDVELRLEIADQVPEKLQKFFRDWQSPIDIRPVYGRNWFSPVKREARNDSWFRAAAPLGDDPALHRAVLAYASDMALLGTAALPHGVNWLTSNLQTASLDHALWLHEDFRADEWLLYATDSPWSGHARGFNRGRIYTRDGKLVANVAQEGLMRLRD